MSYWRIPTPIMFSFDRRPPPGARLPPGLEMRRAATDHGGPADAIQRPLANVGRQTF